MWRNLYTQRTSLKTNCHVRLAMLFKKIWLCGVNPWMGSKNGLVAVRKQLNHIMVTAQFAHWIGSLSLSLYTCLLYAWEWNSEAKQSLSYAMTLWTVWENIQDVLLFITFSFGDHRTCCIAMFTAQAFLSFLNRFCQTMSYEIRILSE